MCEGRRKREMVNAVVDKRRPAQSAARGSKTADLSNPARAIIIPIASGGRGWTASSLLRDRGESAVPAGTRRRAKR